MKNFKNNSVINLSLNQEISNIADRMTRAAASEEVVKSERLAKGMSAVGIINVYNKAKYEAQTRENPAKATMSYVFYRGVYNTEKMGSVAIYGGNTPSLFALMKGRDSLFGHRIVSVSLEKGRRSYVDVKFAA